MSAHWISWLLALSLPLSACTDISYYWQAGMGQMEIIGKRRPISEVLADEAVDGETKRKLRLIRRVQEFATREMALPGEGHYRYYSDLGREYVSWLVVASEPLAIREHSFCYLIVGCLGYKGFFDKSDADELAREMREGGMDVLVRPVRAYSTLGWFDDPVLNTFLSGGDTQLIGTIIHEQTHRLYFLESETAFNESFAEFVEEKGLRLFLAKNGDLGKGDGGEKAGEKRERDELSMERFEAIRRDRHRFREILLRGRERLVALYASQASAEEKRARKEPLFERMRQDFQKERQSFKILAYEDWFAQPLNNAHLVGFSQYTLHVKAFQALFEENGQDFSRFYRAVRELGALPRKERNTRLIELEKKGVASSRPSG